MKPGTHIVCDACNRRRGVAAAECPHYNCPWLTHYGYRELSAKRLGMLADKLFADEDPARGMYVE